jgi:hypothetical protein
MLCAVALAGAALLCLASTASSATRLTPVQFRVIDASYAAWIPVDSDRITASDVDAMERVCRRFAPADELLGALRPGCFVMVRMGRRLVQLKGCPPDLACVLKAVKGVRRAWQQIINRQAAENRAIDRVLSGPCRDVLRTPAQDIRAFDLLTRAFHEFELALAGKGRPNLTHARHLLDQAGIAMEGFMSARTRRARFRKVCR